MKTALACLLACLAWPCAAQPAAAAQGAPKPGAATAWQAGEPDVRRTVIEGEVMRIEELHVRGVAQRIVVTSKAPTGTRYEILTGDGARDLSEGVNTSRGAAGKRVWRVLDF